MLDGARTTSRRIDAARPVDIASLAAFRIIFGTIMLVGILRFLATGWIEKMYGEPTYFFSYAGFDWVRPWPVWAMYLHYAVLAALALAIALGWFHRIACVLFVAGFAYTQLIDVTNYLNHHYLVVLVGAQLALLPANATWSLDVRRRPALRRATVPVWMLWLLRFQIGVVYVFAGLAKAKIDWLFHGQPLNLWLSARTETPLIGRFFDEHWVAMAMSWGGFVFDTTIVLWLSWRRTRLPAYVALIVFHGLTGYLFNIGMFPLIMTSCALIFFSPSWPRRLVPRLGPVPVAETVGPPLDKRIAIALAIHVVLQIALPLRHLVYPGAVLWNEDGMRFAWHVMIREKHGSVMFVARFADGRALEIPPNNYLAWRQEREMGAQPDLILQLARRIGDDLRAKGHTGFTLHAITKVSLNGRPGVPLIDPAVDLLHVRDLGPRTWVLDPPTSAPPHIRPLH
jgi:vitamin K-dependent gamma-carboxylase